MDAEAANRRLLRAMRRIARAMDVRSAAIHRRAGLTLPQLIVLACVRDRGEVTSRMIATEVGLSPPTVVGILDKLATKGLVERTRSPVDRRAVHTRLTPEGIVMLETAPPLLGDHFTTRLQDLSIADRDALIMAVEQIAVFAERDLEVTEASEHASERH